MLVSSHLEKIDRFEAAMASLDPLEDFELWFWSAMVSGTNAVNAALHLARITPAEHAFPSQPGVYYVPDEKGHRPVLKELGDVLHVGRPPIKAPVSQDIQRMMHAMEKIEAFRDPCTRGDMQISAQIVQECQGAYSECMQLLRKQLEENQT
jgi:hypothetical protein